MRTNWDSISQEAELKGLNPISFRFFKENGRYPTKRELLKFIDNVILPTYNEVNKKKIYPVKKRIEKWLKDEEKEQ